jgi:hypothetical protein
MQYQFPQEIKETIVMMKSMVRDGQLFLAITTSNPQPS